MSRKNILISSALGLISFFVYLFTSAPSIYTGDSGEIATAAGSWGIAHPTGFPVYLILSKLFSHLLPQFEFARALNIFSALCAAATIAVVFFIFQSPLLNPPLDKGGRGGVWTSIAAALSFAFGFTFWTHATMLQVYTLTALFFSLAILVFLHWLEVQKSKYLYLLAIICALGAGTHLSFLLFFPFALIFFVLKLMRKEIKINFFHLLLSFFIFVSLCFLVYAYIPWRASANPAMNWGNPSTKESFINYITQRDWSGKIGNRSFESWQVMLKELWHMAKREFTWLGLIIAAIGAIITCKKNRPFFYAGSSVIFFNILLLGNYGNDQDIVVLWRYFLPSYIIMAAFIGFALHKFKKYAPAILIFPAIIFSAHFNQLDRHNNFLVQNATRDIFNSLPQGAVLITSGDTLVGSTAYEQSILGKRKDVILINDSLYTSAWYREAKKKELEQSGKKYAGNISYLIHDNPDTEFFAITNSNSFLKMNYDFYSWGLAYKILDKKKTIKLADFMEMNETFWENYDFGFLKDRRLADDHFANELVDVYTGDLNNLAAYLVNNGDIKGGTDYFEKSLSIRDNKVALYNLANIYMELGETQKALEYKNRFDKLSK